MLFGQKTVAKIVLKSPKLLQTSITPTHSSYWSPKLSQIFFSISKGKLSTYIIPMETQKEAKLMWNPIDNNLLDLHPFPTPLHNQIPTKTANTKIIAEFSNSQSPIKTTNKKTTDLSHCNFKCSLIKNMGIIRIFTVHFRDINFKQNDINKLMKMNNKNEI